MLEHYDMSDNSEIGKKYNRLSVVRAALEIAKASAGSADASVHDRVSYDLQHVAENLERLVEAIEKTLQVN